MGKVPDPKSQVEQITIALIYKFMDEMDAESEELGGLRSFFAGEFARYGWAKLMRSGLGGHETLNLYAEAITRMPENPGVPALFRAIFKNAYLPYRDPETLRMFLKVIDEFSYDHSERLGDAFEYLLSVLGSQGDAGQFRTPRHIIDFMVKIVDPKKDEKVLDPACGTAGFLISSYKHILASNRNEKGESTLTPDEKGLLARDFIGYDISPDMVRLSLVNMYLHGFVDPHIYEYDTLTSQERWNEYADVILANPPFMSPKGGIRPHNRFSVQSKRSEVLFVDYMAEHLKPNGRAAIIVPEGIIFQSQSAYVQLRKMLVDDYLVAVVSLPAGVFNPYSGVKTSILILDKELAKRSSTIGFFKVENDGFGLGAQRREIEKNDLPKIEMGIREYLQGLRSGNVVLDVPNQFSGLVVTKRDIRINGDFNLSRERYREIVIRKSNYPLIAIQEVAEVASGFGFPLDEQGKSDQDIPFLKVSDMNLPGNEKKISSWNNTVSRETLRKLSAKSFPKGTVIFPKIGAAIATNKKRILSRESTYDNNILGIIPSESILSEFLYALLQSFNISIWASDSQPPSMRKTTVEAQKIPFPPLEVQKEIVAEIDGYQKVIDGARAVVESYCPHIPADSEWPIVELKEVCKINPESTDPVKAYPNQIINYIDISSIENGTGLLLGYNEILSNDAPSRARRLVQNNDILLSTVRPNLKAFTLLKDIRSRSIASTGFAVLRANIEKMLPVYLYESVRTQTAINQMISKMGRGAYPSINQTDVESIQIPLPPLTTQRAIVAEIEAEQKLVDANRELIERFEKKIKAVLSRVWSDSD